MYCTIGAVKAKPLPSFTPYKLSRMWGIGLKTVIKTLGKTTHHCIRFIGILYKRFKTDKAQLEYKQISCQYCTLYIDYIKVGVKSVRKVIGGTVYLLVVRFQYLESGITHI